MTLAVTYIDLQAEVARELGWPRNPTDWSAAQDSDFSLIVNSGMRKFYSGEMPGENIAHNWSFLYPLGSLELTASYTTGTIDITGGVVTLSGGVWPSWTDEGELWYTVGSTMQRVEVTTRTDDTLLVVEDTTSTETGLAYTLRRVYYDLPADFGGMYTDGFTFRRDEQWHLPDIKIVGESDIRRIDRQNTGDIYPRYASLIPVTPDQWRVRFYPLAGSSYQVEYRYKIAPAKLTPSNPTTYGGAYYGEAMIHAVLDAAAQRINGSRDRHADFQASMRQAILHDRRNFSVHTAGPGVSGDQGGGSTLGRFRRSTDITNSTFSF